MTISGKALTLFIGISLVHLAMEAMKSDKGRYFTKPLLMPALILYYLTSTESPNPLFVGALALGWLGDTLLMISSNTLRRLFIAGLGAFMLGHICYLTIFFSYMHGIGHVPVWGWAIPAIYVAAGIVVYRLIAPHSGKLYPAVIVYIIVITMMGISTVFPWGSVKTAGASMVIAGAFVFMISDAVNAYHRFVRNVPLEWIFTMGFYLAGQFLLVQGYLMF